MDGKLIVLFLLRLKHYRFILTAQPLKTAIIFNVNEAISRAFIVRIKRRFVRVNEIIIVCDNYCNFCFVLGLLEKKKQLFGLCSVRIKQS